MRTIWLGLCVMAACGGNSMTMGGGGGGGGGGVDAANLAYHPFTPMTRSLALAGGSIGSELQLAITDGTGAIACNLSVDKANSLGVGGGGGGGGGGPDAPNLAFHPFTPRTRSLALAGGNNGSEFQMAITDGTGAIACNLAVDKANSLGVGGNAILSDVTYAAGYPCPTGSYSVPSNCPDMNSDELGGPSVPAHCAYYRAWDATGASLGSIAATAGAITVTGNETSCTFNVSMTFTGKTFSDSFTLTNGLSSQPWCTN